MDEAAVRRIEERLAARFGSKIPAAAYDARGLQTWGTFFRDGTAEEEQPERPASPYTNLFLQDTLTSIPNGAMKEDGKKKEQGEDKAAGKKKAEGKPNELEAERKEAEVGQKRPRPDEGASEVEETKKLLEKGDEAERKTHGPGDLGADDEVGEESDEESEEDEDEESSEEGSSSLSDAEDELTRAASFRDQVADNERYRKRMRDAHAHAPG